MFNAFHNQEGVLPSGLLGDVIGGPAFRMTGFTGPGPEDVILTKSYSQSSPDGTATENTLIELRHTPGK